MIMRSSFMHYERKTLIMRLIMNLIMRVFGHYEPLETPNLIMIVSLIIRLIMRLLVFQCTGTLVFQKLIRKANRWRRDLA